MPEIGEGSGEMNSAYWKCFRLAGMLTKDARNHYFQYMAQVKHCKTDVDATAFLNGISKEIEAMNTTPVECEDCPF
jgi:hypothetical protein